MSRALRRTIGLLTVVGFVAIPTAGWAQLAVPPAMQQDYRAPQSAETEFGAKQGPPLIAGQMYMLPQPEAGVAIRAGRLFDPKTGTNLVDQMILIKGEIITEVGPAAQVKVPAGARVIDLSKATVLPGFIDAHAHPFNVGGQGQINATTHLLHGLRNYLSNLQYGFTTLLDMGAPSYAPVVLRDAIKNGWIMGPRSQVTGVRISPRSGHALMPPDRYEAPFGQGPSFGPGEPYITNTWQNAQNVNSPWLARAAVREHYWFGTDWLKVYMTGDFIGQEYHGAFYPDGKMINVPSLTQEEIDAFVSEANDRGLKVASHAYGGEGLRRALKAGVHMPMHAAVGVTGAEGLDEETISLWKVPLKDGTQRPVLQTLWDLVGGMAANDMKEYGRSRLSLTELSFKRLTAAGIKSVFGSGITGGTHGVHGTQVFQFSMYVKWGMTPAQALRVGTMNAAEALNYHWDQKVGSVEKGKFADIVAVAGDPLADITETERVKFVMKGGTIFRDELTGSGPVSKPTPTAQAVGR